ncbi:S15/NS1 RNA-binding domain-containing protein, partial [Mycena haematopus]
MLRVCAFPRPCRVGNVAPSSSSGFHTSAILSKISEARLRSRALKKRNLARREELVRQQQAARPSVILGSRPAEEHRWRDSVLGKLLVDDSVFAQPPEATVWNEYGVADMPKYKAFGIAEEEANRLFKHLPILTQTTLSEKFVQSKPEEGKRLTQETADLEKLKLVNFARVVDLRNADAGGIAYENRRRIVLAFSSPENPFDPGRTEVQAAILTYRIRKMYAHLTRCKHDRQNKLPLRKLVHQRAKLLKYLKRTARVRYDALLKALCIEPDAVEGELIV